MNHHYFFHTTLPHDWYFRRLACLKTSHFFIELSSSKAYEPLFPFFSTTRPEITDCFDTWSFLLSIPSRISHRALSLGQIYMLLTIDYDPPLFFPTTLCYLTKWYLSVLLFITSRISHQALFGEWVKSTYSRPRHMNHYFLPLLDLKWLTTSSPILSFTL